MVLALFSSAADVTTLGLPPPEDDVLTSVSLDSDKLDAVFACAAFCTDTVLDNVGGADDDLALAPAFLPCASTTITIGWCSSPLISATSFFIASRFINPVFVMELSINFEG